MGSVKQTYGLHANLLTLLVCGASVVTEILNNLIFGGINNMCCNHEQDVHLYHYHVKMFILEV